MRGLVFAVNNGWQDMATAPNDGTLVELWIARPGYEGRLFQDCKYSPRYGWLYQSGHGIYNNDGTEILAWRPTTKGPFDGHEK